jgi:ferredoxin--NADP+ reductase
MGIPGEDVPGSWAATEFVAWYNGHPDYRDLEFDLSSRRAVVIGNGNVAVDVARMLALTSDELGATDIADHALDVLGKSELQEIVVVGRRGPAQAAFTTPELLELGELADADIVVNPAEITLDEHSERWIEGAGAAPRRNLEVLQRYAEREPTGKRRRIVLRFLSSPIRIVGEGGVEAVELVHNELRPGDDGSLRAHATPQRETLEAGIVFRSIGYQGVPTDTVPFDDRDGTIPNRSGSVLDPGTGEPLPGEYSVGWIKRGPTGVIGTNKKDAQETVNSILEDVAQGRLGQPADPDPATLIDLLRERRPEYVDYRGWEAIDAAEQAAGASQGRPRVKLCTFEELLGVSIGPSGTRLYSLHE